MKTRVGVGILCGLLAGVGCSASDDPGDGMNDSFATGKGDGSLAEGSAEARAVLRLVNDPARTLVELDDQAKLNSRAAKNILAHRNGADGEAGTADDNPFDDLAELDAVSFVGPVALSQLLSYATAQGLLSADTVCHFQLESPFGLDSEALDAFEVTSRTLDDPTALSDLERRQLLMLASLEFFPTNDMQEVFEGSDDGDFGVIDLELDLGFTTLRAEWYKYFAGDTEVGVVFKKGTTRVIAEVGDGDVQGCLQDNGIEGQATCTFELRLPFGDTSSDIPTIGSTEVTVDDVASLSELQKAQIARAVGFDTAEESVEAVDDSIVDLIDVKWELDFFRTGEADWVSYGAGGNEVGMLFKKGTTEAIAEVSDGDVMPCID